MVYRGPKTRPERGGGGRFVLGHHFRMNSVRLSHGHLYTLFAPKMTPNDPPNDPPNVAEMTPKSYCNFDHEFFEKNITCRTQHGPLKITESSKSIGFFNGFWRSLLVLVFNLFNHFNHQSGSNFVLKWNKFPPKMDSKFRAKFGTFFELRLIHFGPPFGTLLGSFWVPFWSPETSWVHYGATLASNLVSQGPFWGPKCSSKPSKWSFGTPLALILNHFAPMGAHFWSFWDAVLIN